ncbi:membrane protein [Mycolicibacterium conceptionense]|jgi:hypothetical protein|uniref:Integral membrane alanine and leucine rich protein n=1 Tax=Mycolicibacterium conceptionense TaxID=451644 RepID=A0A0J8U993_9MYCO|nr:DUF3159 domain-containing protein [Mycolicibacterium conceptionense]KMV18123.1 membrane protein [Mycolicibacterium conceptionense]OBK03436.1 hypothetical protein A5639_22910 [Mycolicibacterium conceptionense]OMB70392.1 hypothetical protein A5741_08070 [Mycolicibacterium conceptionense]OMB79140.1 hypothetical protein A5746_07540 [Mycolicibacterium conceptionense]ORV27360.1 hypothetical protein AWB98_10595 [Mycolicibacterium conceptionense]
MTDSPLDGLMARVGGISGMVYSALPVTVYATVSALAGRVPAIISALVTAAVVLAWQLLRRESVRPALWGFVGVAVCALLALVTGQAKDFYLPGIWMSLASAIVMTGSILVRRPLVGVIWAWATGRDSTWRQVPGVRLVFNVVTAVLATVSWSRFLVQNYLYDTGQDGLLAVARLAMGWPLFVVTTTLVLLSARYAIRALPRSTS